MFKWCHKWVRVGEFEGWRAEWLLERSPEESGGGSWLGKGN